MLFLIQHNTATFMGHVDTFRSMRGPFGWTGKIVLVCPD